MRAQVIVRAPNGARGGRSKVEVKVASVGDLLSLGGAQNAGEAGTERPCVVDGPSVTLA